MNEITRADVAMNNVLVRGRRDVINNIYYTMQGVTYSWAPLSFRFQLTHSLGSAGTSRRSCLRKHRQRHRRSVLLCLRPRRRRRWDLQSVPGSRRLARQSQGRGWWVNYFWLWNFNRNSWKDRFGSWVWTAHVSLDARSLWQLSQ